MIELIQKDEISERGAVEIESYSHIVPCCRIVARCHFEKRGKSEKDERIAD